MIFITYTAAVFAAALNASSSVVQRLATHKPSTDRLFSHKFVISIIKSRLFISGFALQIAGFIAQATALKNGPLIIVEPLLTCDLVFLLLLIHWKLGIVIEVRDWSAVAAIILGLTGLYIALHPQGGHLNYSLTPWIIVISILGTMVILVGYLVRRLKNQTIRAVLAGMGAAVAYALNAAFTKLCLNIYNHHGLLALMTSWPVYALIISGITSIYLMVNAYGSGPLAITQPIMEVFEPAIAVSIGITIFGDGYNTSAFSLVVGFICALVLLSGIVRLASSPKIHQAGESGM